MASNSALLVRLYPNSRQSALLRKACEYRFHYYKALALWWNDTHENCRKLYAEFCKTETDEGKRKEFSKTLPWPPRKVTKEGLNDTCLRVYYPLVSGRIKFAVERDFTDTPRTGKSKGTPKNYGDVFRLNAKFMPAVYGDSIVASSASAWCKDDFARAITMTFKDKKSASVRFPAYRDAKTFKVSVKGLPVRRNGAGRVIAIGVPFLSSAYRKKFAKKYGEQCCSALEWFACSLSDSQFAKVSDASAVTFTENAAGEWFASVSVYKPQEQRLETGIECGIDLGIKTAATVAYNAEGECSPEYDAFSKHDLPVAKIKMLEEKIAHLQKLQMRRIKTWLRLNKDGIAKGLKMDTAKGDRTHNAVFVYRKRHQSASFRVTEKRIAQIHIKIANIRKNFAEQFSREIANTCDSAGMENLNTKGMMKNGCLARSIARVGFYQIRAAIARKTRVVLLDTFAPSSQVCSYCGHRNEKLRGKRGLRIREWVCPHCGHVHDRDKNAASNIRPSNHEILSSYCKTKK